MTTIKVNGRTKSQAYDDLLLASFPFFLEWAFGVLNPGRKFTKNWHLDALAYQVNQAVMSGDGYDLLVTLPPRSLKSITFSVAFVAWALGNNPRLRFMCVSYGEELAAKLARDCRKLMKHPRYLSAFPETRLSREAQNDFDTTQGGGRFSESLSGGLTGRGADYVIIDDPIKPSDARSEIMRDNVDQLYRETLASRLDDKKRGVSIVVMQRLHEEDLAGRLLAMGGWTHLNLPAIAPNDMRVPRLHMEPYLWRAGTALDEEREPVGVLDRQRLIMRDAAFSAQYLQAPLPEKGQLVKRDWLIDYEEVPDRRESDKVLQSWDCANGDGDEADFSVCVTLLVREDMCYILDVRRVRLVFPDLRQLVMTLAQAYRADVILIEDAASGRQLLQELAQDPPPRHPTVLPRKAEGDKKDRLGRASLRIQAGRLLLPANAPWRAEFVRELLGFPLTRHDDQVDALSQALIYLMDFGPDIHPMPLFCSRESPWYVEPPDDEFEDKDEVDLDNETRVMMGLAIKVQADLCSLRLSEALSS